MSLLATIEADAHRKGRERLLDPGRILAGAVLFAILLLSNRHATMASDALIVERCCSDAYNYVAIADAYPGLPDSGVRAVDYHHGQRFVFPWIAGGLAHFSGLPIDLSFRLLTISIGAAATAVSVALLHQTGISASTQTGLLALFLFNPYVFRLSLGFPWFVSDVAFVFGLVLTLLGLLRGRAWIVVVGVTVAALARQTAILLLPTILLWLLLAGDGFSRRVRILLATVCVAVVTSAYMLTGAVASTFSKPSINRGTVTGLFIWLAEDFDARALVEFLIRGAIPLLPLLAVCVVLGIRRRTAYADLIFWLLLSMTAAVASQPILGGPVWTGGNIARLVMLGVLPSLIAVARLMASSGIELRGSLLLIFVGSAFLGSLHHIYSFIGQDDSAHAGWFLAMLVLSSAVIAGCMWLASSRSRLEGAR